MRRVPRAGHEAVLYGAWNAILSWQFDVRDGYITRPQDKHASQSGKGGFSDLQGGFSDLHTYHYVDNATTPTKFLIVQWKRPDRYTRGSTWLEGVDQLSRYLAATHGTRRKDRRSLSMVSSLLEIG